jgi:hypothetical protein
MSERFFLLARAFNSGVRIKGGICGHGRQEASYTPIERTGMNAERGVRGTLKRGQGTP